MSKPNALEKLLFGANVKGWSDLAHLLTGYRYVTLTGKDPAKWPDAWHQGTKWRYYRQPEAEIVAVPKVRWRAIESREFRWPDIFRGVTIRQSDPGGASSSGVGTGLPMQVGTDRMRTVTWGWAIWGERNRIEIPKPAVGKYWIGGSPGPSYDRNACVIAPSGAVYELIQFDPDAPENPFTNQALGVGVFVDTELVDGKPTGAGRVANSAYVWDRRSAANPHTQRLVLADYNGHDGLLPDTIPGYDVPKIGDLFVLDPQSSSARAMLAKGGDCAARAAALITYGARVLDRSGYSDVKDNATQVGTAPHPTTMAVQAGTWPGSNIAEWEIGLEDLRYVTSFEPE